MTPVDPGAAGVPRAPGEGEPPPRWQLALEQAHALAHRVGRALEDAPASVVDLRPAARALESAIGSLYEAFGSAGDRLRNTQAAEADLDRCNELLGDASRSDPDVAEISEWLNEARAELGIAEERFARVPPAPPLPERDLCASRGVPALHRLARGTLTASFSVLAPLPPLTAPAPPLPPARTREELDEAVRELERRAAERRKASKALRERSAQKQRRSTSTAMVEEDDLDPPKGFARGHFTAMAESDFFAARARDCFEEVAMVGVQRAPLLGDPWRASKFLEQRLLASVDAIAALGPPAIARIEPMVRDAPAKDPSRGFAAAMILGCVEGRDTLGAAERVLRHLGAAVPGVMAQFGGALKLVPHPDLALWLRALLSDPDAAYRALAVDVLAYRGLATPAQLLAAAQDPAPAVVAAALPGLGLLRPPELEELIPGLLVHTEPSVREAAWWAMALGGHARAASVLARELAGPLAARAALPLALVGDDRDAARLLGAMTASPTSALVLAVGWAGASESVPALIDLVSHRDPVLALTAAYALDRITGARLYEDVEVPPEVIAIPDVESPDTGEPKPMPLARMVSDPRDRPSEGSNDEVTQPTVREDLWRAFWREHEQGYRPGARYRRGHAYTPKVSLWELDAWPVTPAERRWLVRELIVRTGQHERVDPHDFVAVQEGALRGWEPVAERASSVPGGWGRVVRR